MSTSPDTPRYLCSQLVELFTGDKTQWVNLEEIWPEGAALECEEEILTGINATILAGEAKLEGRITHVSRDEFGWQVEIAFPQDSRWSLEKLRPEHLVNPSDLT